uniref:Uncharacterized protein n=1 Tax=Arundo donax TaxID=35708 RepID=A0A0A9CA74_ARUDO
MVLLLVSFRNIGTL